jgi:putative peptidoglycan lipid II flippase
MYDTKTPFKISLTSMVINAILAILFVRVFGLGVWSLGLAFTISSFFNMALLLVSLYKILPQLDETYELIYKINRISIASLIMGLTLYIPMKIFDRFIFDTTRTLDLILLTTVVTSLGLISFIFIVRFFKLKELDYIYLVLEKFKKSAYSLSFLRRQH